MKFFFAFTAAAVALGVSPSLAFARGSAPHGGHVSGHHAAHHSATVPHIGHFGSLGHHFDLGHFGWSSHPDHSPFHIDHRVGPHDHYYAYGYSLGFGCSYPGYDPSYSFDYYRRPSYWPPYWASSNGNQPDPRLHYSMLNQPGNVSPQPNTTHPSSKDLSAARQLGSQLTVLKVRPITLHQDTPWVAK